MQLTIFATGFCLVISWLVPLHFLPWVSWHNELLAFLAVFALAGVTLLRLLLKNKRTQIPIPKSAIVFFGLLLILVIQTMTGLITFAGDALVIGMYMSLCFMAVMLGYGPIETTCPLLAHGDIAKKPWCGVEMLAFVLLVGALASALIAFVQVLDVWEDNNWIARMLDLRRPGGNLAQPNQLATLLLMGIASMLFLYELGRLSAWSAVPIFLVLCTGLAATESRTGVLSFLMLTIWWSVGRARVGFGLPWRVVTLAALGFLALFGVWPLLMSTTDNLPPDAAVNIRAGLRLVVWPQLLEAVALHPWWGWGLREVSEAHNAVAHAYEISEPFTYSHNILIDLAIGMGLPLTMLIVVTVIVWLWQRVLGVSSLLTWYCLAAVLPVAIHSMLEFPFAYAYFLVPVMFLLGLLERTVETKPFLRIGVLPMFTGLLLVIVTGAWSVVEYVSIEEEFRVARFEALRIGQTPADHVRPKVHLLTQLDALLDGARLVPQPRMSRETLDLARKVALRYPWPATQNRYALSLALNGNTEEALRQLRVIRALHGEKTYAEIRLNWEVLGKNKYPQLRELRLP